MTKYVGFEAAVVAFFSSREVDPSGRTGAFFQDLAADVDRAQADIRETAQRIADSGARLANTFAVPGATYGSIGANPARLAADLAEYGAAYSARLEIFRHAFNLHFPKAFPEILTVAQKERTFRYGFEVRESLGKRLSKWTPTLFEPCMSKEEAERSVFGIADALKVSRDDVRVMEIDVTEVTS